MRVNDDYETWNVAAESQDAESVLSFWKQALHLRKTNDVFVRSRRAIVKEEMNTDSRSHLQIYGDFELVAPEHDQLFAYTRKLEGVTALVLMNFSTTDIAIEPSHLPQIPGLQLALSNRPDTPQHVPTTLRGYEGSIYLTPALN